ncbi:hypothetical protein Athai_18030 [Actinocatenispora thailandica]|uniref:DUF1177 domain-containing protein n=1 Tax=Actinocatenispora thailandica TaxID=227318 RepID=A0A7R7DM84_9ACTN|nr:DUF1177 domain-containing protein [Actinocatenispora thailandica]BCJ34300.1 hypothetical protein Athai_18030 [Actinocatenispora thailandica]
MSWRHVIDAYELLDDPAVTGTAVAEYLVACGAPQPAVHTVRGDKGSTDFVRLTVPGRRGAAAGGDAPTLSVIGRLGGLGARPEQIGFVSDGDGALTAVSVAAKLSAMHARGDVLDGDVVVATHICPDAPTRPHDPVPFMDSPVDLAAMNEHEVDPDADAVLSVDTTKGNRIVNVNGFAISPTVKQGWILRVSEDLLAVQQRVTGSLPAVLPLAMADITPYGNGAYHVNSILQPTTSTAAPVVGVAITTETPVAGSATGATQLSSVESAVRFCIEVAKDFGRGALRFHDQAEFEHLVTRYGPMTALQTQGNA